MRRDGGALIAVLAAALALAAPGVAAGTPAKPRPGDLDPTFGHGGRTITAVDFETEWNDVEVQAAGMPDGGVVVAGARRALNRLDFPARLTIARYGANGRLLRSFGDEGLLSLADVGGQPFSPSGMAVDSHGRIVVAGSSVVSNLGYVESSIAVIVRLLPNGEPDVTFGKDGALRSYLGAPAAVRSVLVGETTKLEVEAGSVAVDAEDRIVVSGEFLDGDASCNRYTEPVFHTFVSRLTAAGGLDPTFGEGGARIEHGLTEPGQLVLDPGGAPYYSAMLRADGCWAGAALDHLGVGGAPDPGFGEGGLLSTSAFPQPLPVAIDHRGRVLLLDEGVGNSRGKSRATLRRLEPDGAPDLGFGSGGEARISPPGGGSRMSSIAIENNGRILISASLAGPATAAGARRRRIALIRLDADGRPDPTFGRNGRVVTDFGPHSGAASAQLVLDGRGRAVVAGTLRSPRLAGHQGFALARYALGR